MTENRYTETLTLTLPYTPELAVIASKIGRAMDPDVGGADSFIQTEDGRLTCRTPCTAEFKGQAQALLSDANMLHQVVQMDYAARWADLTPPTLAECEAFLAGLVVE